MDAAFGIDRHARRAERLDIAMDGPFRDLELARELAGGHPAAGLEEQQHRHETRRAHARTIRLFLPGDVMFPAAPVGRWQAVARRRPAQIAPLNVSQAPGSPLW